MIGLRDHSNRVSWARFGLTLSQAKRYHDAGWTFSHRSWVPSLGSWTYTFFCEGEEPLPVVDESEAVL